MTSIYEQPTWKIMLQAVEELTAEKSIIKTAEMLHWFDLHYPLIQPTTVRKHLRLGSVNVPLDSSHATWRPEARVLWKLDRSTYRRYVPSEDGDPLLAPADSDDDIDDDFVDDARFLLEVHLEEFIESNWSVIKFPAPLQIWSGDGESGRQYETDVGRIDFLCVDTSNGDLVVVELKRGRTSDRVVGQILRYMGWVRKHLANGASVRGLVITHQDDDRMAYALSVVPQVTAMTYRVSFELQPAAAL